MSTLCHSVDTTDVVLMWGSQLVPMHQPAPASLREARIYVHTHTGLGVGEVAVGMWEGMGIGRRAES